jgi:hypothetical protein
MFTRDLILAHPHHRRARFVRNTLLKSVGMRINASFTKGPNLPSFIGKVVRTYTSGDQVVLVTDICCDDDKGPLEAVFTPKEVVAFYLKGPKFRWGSPQNGNDCSARVSIRRPK